MDTETTPSEHGFFRIRSERSILSMSAKEAKTRRIESLGALSPTTPHGTYFSSKESLPEPGTSPDGIMWERASDIPESFFAQSRGVFTPLTPSTTGCERCADHNVLRQRVAQLEEQVEAYEERAHEAALLKKKLTILQEERDCLQREGLEKKDSVANLTRELSAMQITRERSREIAQKDARTIEELRAKSTTLEERLKEASRGSRKVVRTAADVTYLETKLEAAQKDLAGFRDLCSAASKKVSTLQEDLAGSKGALEIALKECQDAKRMRDADANLLLEKNLAVRQLELALRNKDLEAVTLRRTVDELSAREAEVCHLRDILTSLDSTENVRMHRAADTYINIKSAAPPKLLRNEKHRGRNCERLAFSSSCVQRPGARGSIRQQPDGSPQRGGGVMIPGGKRSAVATPRRRSYSATSTRLHGNEIPGFAGVSKPGRGAGRGGGGEGRRGSVTPRGGGGGGGGVGRPLTPTIRRSNSWRRLSAEPFGKSNTHTIARGMRGGEVVVVG